MNCVWDMREQAPGTLASFLPSAEVQLGPESRHHISRYRQYSSFLPALTELHTPEMRRSAQVSPWPLCKFIPHRNWGHREAEFSPSVDTVVWCSLTQAFYLMRCWWEGGGNRVCRAWGEGTARCHTNEPVLIYLSRLWTSRHRAFRVE